jgi:SAM-dependent methyltransferase
MSDIIQLSTITEENSFPATYFDLADEKHFWCKGRIEAFFYFIKSLDVPLVKPFKVLDVGCGNGVVRKQIETCTEWVTDGVDLNHSALLKNEGVRGNTYYYNIFDFHEPFHNKYDIIILFDVLEHIDQPLSFFQALGYHVHKGGWLFINVPALECLRSPYDEVQGHIRRYTKKKMREELLESPFEPSAFAYWGLSLLPVVIARKIYLQLLINSKDVYMRGFKPPSSLINSWLSGLLRIENKLFPHVPLGTSLLCAARKM